MTIEVLIPLAGILINGACALLVLVKNPRGLINIRWFFLIIGIILWHSGEGLIHLAQPGSIEIAGHWIAAIGISIFPSLFLHFSIAYADMEYLFRRDWNYGIIYGIGFIFLVILTSGNLAEFPLCSHQTIVPKSWMFWVYIGWLSFLYLVGLGLCFERYRRTKSWTEKKQQLLFLTGVAVPLGVLLIDASTTATSETSFLFILPFVTSIGIVHSTMNIFRSQVLIVTPHLLGSTIVDVIGDLLVVIDQTSKVVFANDAFRRRILSTPEYEIKDLQSSKFIVEAEVVQQILRKESGSSSSLLEVAFLTQKGERFPVLLSISPIRERGEVMGWVLVGHDLSERQSLMQKYEESQRKYENIVESSLDGILLIQDGRLVYSSRSATNIFGYKSVEEMQALDFKDKIAPASRFFEFEHYKGYSVGDDILRNFEMKGLTKYGKAIDLEVNARLVTWNGSPAVQASFRDITEQKNLEREQALWLWEQETMSAIDHQLVSSVGLQVVLDVIAYYAKMLTHANWVGVMMIDAELDQYRWRSVMGNRRSAPQESFAIRSEFQAIIEKKEPVVSRDISSDPKYPESEFSFLVCDGILSAARFPLVIEGKMRGLMVIAFRHHHDFTARELRLLSALAEKSSIAVASAQLYENLLLREKELELLAGARVQAQEEERRRIAREIHDSLGQLLTAIKFNIEVLEDSTEIQIPDDRERLNDIKNLLENAISEAREISYNLMPSILLDFGLAPALQMLCEQFSKRNNLELQYTTVGVESRLNAEIDIGLYRIAQEALNNIAKHAQAHHINVQLIGDAESIRLAIDDDGVGFIPRPFDPATNRRGMGLVSMRERASALQGALMLNSRPGQGTEIIVEIPMRNVKSDGQHENSFSG
ncbi:MAG: PAS domain S-box protein [bacterium]